MEKIIIGDRHAGETRTLIEDYVNQLKSGEDAVIISRDIHIYAEIKELLGDDFDRYKDHINVYIFLQKCHQCFQIRNCILII